MKYLKYLRLFLGVINCITLGRLIEKDAPFPILLIGLFLVIFFLGYFLYENERDFKDRNVQNENNEFQRDNII